MNSKLFFKTLGLSMLTVGLVAVPGSSARKQESTGTTGQKSFQVEIPPDAAAQMAELQERLNNLNIASDGDDNVQVLVSGGGSWLGAGISEVTSEKVKTFKLPAERGVVLGKIVPDSPAAKAGLKENDVVTEINGQRVEGTEEFRRMIREIPSGRTVQFVVWRDGRSQNISVTLGKSEMRHGGTFVAPAAPGSFHSRSPKCRKWTESLRAALGRRPERAWGSMRRILTANSAIILAHPTGKEFWFVEFFRIRPRQRRG